MQNDLAPVRLCFEYEGTFPAAYWRLGGGPETFRRGGDGH